jgi:hypothetical protein
MYVLISLNKCKKKIKIFLGKRFLKVFFTTLLIFSWLFTSWPPLINNPRFPPEISHVKANTSTYDFSDCGSDCDTSAYWWFSDDDVDAFPFAGATGNRNGHGENNDTAYSQISSSDDTRFTSSDPGNGDEIFMWFEMDISETPGTIDSITFSFEGHPNTTTSNFSIWVKTAAGAYEQNASWTQVGSTTSITADTDTTITGTLSVNNITDYIDANGMIVWGVYTVTTWLITEVDYVKMDVNYSPVEQEGFRFRYDDGDEGGDGEATWIDTQDTNITRNKNQNTRLRMLLNGTAEGDPDSLQYQLEYMKSTDSVYRKIETESLGSVTETYINAGTYSWKAPEGVTSVDVELWGSGGAGGGITTDTSTVAGGGGAGGSYSKKSNIEVTPGNTYTLVVAAAKAGTTGANGGQGISSTFNTNTVIAVGGPGGQSYENGAAGGIGTTTGCVGDVYYAGGNGGNGGADVGSGGGGGNAGTTTTGGNGGNGSTGPTAGAAGVGGTAYGGNTGNGAIGIIANGNGGTGVIPGGAGSGAFNTGTADNRRGGSGNAGMGKISYIADTPSLNYYSAQASGTTSISVAYPSSISRGDLLVLAIANKHPNNSPTTPSGWTLPTNGQASGGIGSDASADQGNVYSTIFIKEADGTESGNLSVSVPSGNSTTGTMMVFSKGYGKEWDYALVNGSDNSAGTDWVIDAATDPGIQANDYVLVASALNNDLWAYGSQDLNSEGVTYANEIEQFERAYSGGLDLELVVSTHFAYSGTSTAAPDYTMAASNSTVDANPAGASIILRIRQIDAPIQLSASSNVGSSGENTTYQLAAPNGKSTSNFSTGRIQDDENPSDAVDIANGNYTEMEWSLAATDTVTSGDIYYFRVTNNGKATLVYTVTPQWTIQASISISIDDGGVSYGIVAESGSKTTLPTTGLDDMQTITNDSDALVDLAIKGYDASGGGCTWTLDSSIGTDQYVHQFCNETDNDCSSPPTSYTNLDKTGVTLKDGVAIDGTADFHLRLLMPSDSTCAGEQDINVTVIASES